MTTFADRTVTGVVAGMVAVTAAATAVGFWLSYSGLHDFALRAGLRGPEAWAWPSSVDLFIAAGEAGVTISALRKESDWPAWCYLALGLAMSVTGNVMHVYTRHLPWPPYAVAAVPPIAAMLALGALLRQVYRIASSAPGHVPDEFSGLNGYREQAAELFAADLKAGKIPGIRAIKSGLHVNQDRAKQVQTYLRTRTST